jgi:hypothetical protein
MTTESPVVCLVSHKCRREDPGPLCKWSKGSEAYDWLLEVFPANGVSLLIDPFEAGVELEARIETLSFDAVLFLFCFESWASTWCRKELEVAQCRGVPIFIVCLCGTLPPELLSGRIVIDFQWPPTGDFEKELCQLARTIRHRGELRRQILRAIDVNSTAKDQRDAAIKVEDEEDVAAVAEFIPLLDKHYNLKVDPAARASLARALAQTRSSHTVPVLQKWLAVEDHPFCKDAIYDALEVVSGGSHPRHRWSRRQFAGIVIFLIVLSMCFLVWRAYQRTGLDSTVPPSGDGRGASEIIDEIENELREMSRKLDDLKRKSS